MGLERFREGLEGWLINRGGWERVVEGLEMVRGSWGRFADHI